MAGYKRLHKWYCRLAHQLSFILLHTDSDPLPHNSMHTYLDPHPKADIDYYTYSNARAIMDSYHTDAIPDTLANKNRNRHITDFDPDHAIIDFNAHPYINQNKNEYKFPHTHLHIHHDADQNIHRD
jgi:hypothetical protein